MRLVGAVGIGPTTFGLKDQNSTQPLQSATVSYRKISHDVHAKLLCSGVVVRASPHKSRTLGRAHETRKPINPLPVTEVPSTEAWSADEERTIKTMQHAESIPRAEASRSEVVPFYADQSVGWVKILVGTVGIELSSPFANTEVIHSTIPTKPTKTLETLK